MYISFFIKAFMLGIIIQLDIDTSSNNNHLSSYKKNIIKKEKKIHKKMGGLYIFIKNCKNKLDGKKVTTIICHHMKKLLLKKKKKYTKNIGGLDQNSYVNKNDT